MSSTARYPHSSVEASMTRTFYPKYTSYMGDGSGRDSYVILDNGGLASGQKRAMMWRPNKCPQKIDPKPHKNPPAHKYQSDGSGRDSYVIRNSGGLVADFRCTKTDVNFISTLRQQNHSPLRQASDRWRGPDGTDYLNWMCPKDQMAARKQVSKQRELTNRLSPHKYPARERESETFDRRRNTTNQLGGGKYPNTFRAGAQTLMGMRGVDSKRKPFDVSENSAITIGMDVDVCQFERKCALCLFRSMMLEITKLDQS